MPYLKQVHRDSIEPDQIPLAATPAHLNFQFTLIVRKYIEGVGLSYQALNDCVGALECCKLELYRRLAAPYEDKKCKENGDVY